MLAKAKQVTHPMENKDTQRLKTGGFDAEPAKVETTDNRTFDAEHYIINEKTRIVSLYTGPRKNGIDVQIPLENIAVIDRRVDRDKFDVVEEGDVVTVRDEDLRDNPGPWKVEKIENGTAELWSAMQPLRYEPVEDLNVVKKGEDRIPPIGPVNNRGGDLVSLGDGSNGKSVSADVTTCECGADLTTAAELGTTHVPVAGARMPNPRTREAPTARCGECGVDVAAVHEMAGVVALWQARGEPLPGYKDENRGER